MPSRFAHHWQLHPDVDFLNHGSFGATPTIVLEDQRRWIEELEREPIQFLAPERTLLPKLEIVRERIARLVNAAPRDIAFVRNATDGVNAVVRSFPFRSGDEVVITSHGYNACNNAVRFAADSHDARIAVAPVPFPIDSCDQVLDAIESVLTERTRLLLVDHVTSSTGLVFPVEDIVALARSRGVRVMVDGAHAPGMVPVDLRKLEPDYYVANHHKWLCGPKTSGFLYVRSELQPEVRPTVISHGANSTGHGESRFQAEFNWVGTYDPSPLLAVPSALEFLDSLHAGGIAELMQANHRLVMSGRQSLLDALGLQAPAPAAMIGSLASVVLPRGEDWTVVDAGALQRNLFDQERMEVPIFVWGEAASCLRISAQAYNDASQFERLANALRKHLSRGRSH